MIYVQLKIEPERELFNHLHDIKEIKSYCSGKKGLVIFSTDQTETNNYQKIDFHTESGSVLNDSIKPDHTHIASFTCNCLNNPPSKLRKIIQTLGGTILDPVRIKNNWEYLDLVFNSETAIDKLQKELGQNFEFEIKALEPFNKMTSFSFLIKNNIAEILTFLTIKQQETLINAWKHGYYKIPRQISTEKLAKKENISRYSYEKKLRIAENKIMDKLLPILLLYAPRSE